MAPIPHLQPHPVNSGSWWWTGRPGVLQFMGSQRVGHDWATEMNWTYYTYNSAITSCRSILTLTHLFWPAYCKQRLIKHLENWAWPLFFSLVALLSWRVYAWYKRRMRDTGSTAETRLDNQQPVNPQVFGQTQPRSWKPPSQTPAETWLYDSGILWLLYIIMMATDN